MSCQPGPPRARHGSVTEVTTKASTGATHSLIKVASFHGAYLKYEYIDSAEFFIWYSEKYLFFAHVWLCRSGIMWRRYIQRLLDCSPHACSAMEHVHLIIPIWDMQPRNIGIHRQLSRSGTCNQGTSGYTPGDTPSAYPDSRSADETYPAYLWGECDTGLCTIIDDVLHRV